MRKNNIFGADKSSSVHIANKNKDILFPGQGPTQGLDDTTLTAKAKYHINFPKTRKRFVLHLDYHGSKSCLLVNTTKIYYFKAKVFDYTPCLGNISKDFTVNMKKQD